MKYSKREILTEIGIEKLRTQNLRKQKTRASNKVLLNHKNMI